MPETPNCHVRELCEVSQRIFLDALAAFPALGREFERDLTRLLKMAQTRGIRLFTVDLPSIGKHLDRCLSEGEYNPSGLPLTKRYTNGVVIPKFLRGLYLLVFEPSGRLKESANSEAVLFLRQLLMLGKKTKLNCSEQAVVDEVHDFYALDQSLPEPDGFWSDESVTSFDVSATYRGFYESSYYASKIEGRPDVRTMSTFLLNLDKVSRLVSITLGSYDPSEWSFRHGPGAISEATGPTNKYSWRNWSNRLENAFPLADCGFHHYGAWASWVSEQAEITTLEPCARLIAVPKTYTKPRLIAAEPSEHMWCQQNVWHYLCERVANSWIGESVRFRDQSHNQELCREGSRDDSYVTLDLSAASDRVTCSAVGQMFRCNAPLLLALQATRTRFLNQSLAHDVPEVIPLRKFSTMGNACTFPVESLLFFSVAVAAILTSRGVVATVEAIREAAGEVAVFGDDIVAPKDSRDLLEQGLGVLDFKVNVDKTFGKGNFRESCGVDAFMGEQVTPVYWRTLCDGSPESVASVLETANHFYQRWFLNAAEYLASTIQRSFPLVPTDSGVPGFKSFVKPPAPTNFKSRWNDALQRMEYKLPSFCTRQPRTSTSDDSAILQYFTEAPSRFSAWVHGIPQRASLKLKTSWVPFGHFGEISR